MEDYTAVSLITVDIDTGNLINNFIEQQQINFNILKEDTSYKTILSSNSSDLNINLLLDKKKEVICIITKDDYKSLIKLMYNNEKKIINYNNDYYLLEIKLYLEFNSHINNLHNIQQTFKKLG